MTDDLPSVYVPLADHNHNYSKMIEFHSYVRFSKLKLTSRARDYWYNIENLCHGRYKPAITNWEDMKENLREKYVS